MEATRGLKYCIQYGILAPIPFYVLIALWILSLSMSLRDLQLTRHAQESHANLTWNAETIRQYMATQCTPKRYDCPTRDSINLVCFLTDARAIMLVIGKSTGRIVTGYALDARRVGDGCIELAR